ncbi:unnamed protein product, partial [Eruca vesicaria subsp. sativa]|nr:unnamed protein product [Eruca vesicaria subsp. sativa]
MCSNSLIGSENCASRTLRIFSLENITRCEKLDSSILVFCSKTPVDIDAKRIRLQSNSYTTTTLLDIVTTAMFQAKEIGGSRQDWIVNMDCTGPHEDLEIYLEAIDQLRGSIKFFSNNKMFKSTATGVIGHAHNLLSKALSKLEDEFIHILQNYSKPMEPDGFLNVFQAILDHQQMVIGGGGGKSR